MKNGQEIVELLGDDAVLSPMLETDSSVEFDSDSSMYILILLLCITLFLYSCISNGIHMLNRSKFSVSGLACVVANLLIFTLMHDLR